MPAGLAGSAPGWGAACGCISLSVPTLYMTPSPSFLLGAGKTALISWLPDLSVGFPVRLCSPLEAGKSIGRDAFGRPGTNQYTVLWKLTLPEKALGCGLRSIPGHFSWLGPSFLLFYQVMGSVVWSHNFPRSWLDFLVCWKPGWTLHRP